MHISRLVGTFILLPKLIDFQAKTDLISVCILEKYALLECKPLVHLLLLYYPKLNDSKSYAEQDVYFS